MKLISLKLRGAIGIKKGLGLDEIALDFSDVSGLVSFEGANGKGKSTILENLTPFRTLASRKRSLQHHFGLKDSSREIVFEFDGHTYKTLIKIDPENEKQEGFIWKDGESQVTGKVKEYDRYIETLLGSENLFFNSIFNGQNSEKISDMTTGELKGLFSEFLRLDRYIDFESTAKQAGNVLSFRIDEKDRQIEKLEGQIKAGESLNNDIVFMDGDKWYKNEELSKSKNALASAEISLESNKKLVHQNEIAREKIKTLTAEKARIEKDLTADKQAMEDELQEIRVKAQKINVEIQALESAMADKEKILKAVADTEKATSDKERINKELDALLIQEREISTRINEKEKALTDLRAKIKAAQDDNESALLKAEIKALKIEVQTLDKRPENCNSPTCSFIAKALEASRRLPEAEKALNERLVELSNITIENDKEKEKIIREATSIGKEKLEIDAKIEVYRETVRTLNKTISDNKSYAAAADAITKAETQLESLKERKAELIEQGMKIKATAEERIKEKEYRQSRYHESIIEAEKDINPNAETLSRQDQNVIILHKTSISNIEKELKEIDIKIAQLETKLKERDAAKTELEQVKHEKAALSQELQEWSYLKNACGANGLRALEIDSVAPVITGYANNLLQETFGPMFSVRFRTQNDEGKEVLDILVIREDGTEVLLDNLSGGEKVWILKSLRLAMTLISKEKSGRNYKTLLCDEEDGPLSRDNATQFIMLYRSVMQLAGMDTCFYISHRPEALAMADHRIIFNGNGIEVE